MKHAFLSKEKAMSKNGKSSLGIEHASDEDIRLSLMNVYTPDDEIRLEEITLEDLMLTKLIGHPKSKERRTRIGSILNIGQTNSKQLHKRLQMFQITVEQFGKAVAQLEQEEHHE